MRVASQQLEKGFSLFEFFQFFFKFLKRFSVLTYKYCGATIEDMKECLSPIRSRVCKSTSPIKQSLSNAAASLMVERRYMMPSVVVSKLCVVRNEEVQEDDDNLIECNEHGQLFADGIVI